MKGLFLKEIAECGGQKRPRIKNWPLLVELIHNRWKLLIKKH
jgi:hypothetical protein